MPASADLVHETSTSTGTGNLTLAAVNGKVRFSTPFGTGVTLNVFDYFISNRGAAEYERGTGHMSDANTLVRDTVLASSNAGAAVNFSAGIKDVMNDNPAGTQARLDLTDQAQTGGARISPLALGNLSGVTITPDPGDRPVQQITNNGAGTIAPGSNHGRYELEVINTTGAGAITTSGWTKVTGSFDTTTTSKFRCSCAVSGNFSSMIIEKVV
jgi:hypothetical protein